jgi:hypothetical protein
MVLLTATSRQRACQFRQTRGLGRGRMALVVQKSVAILAILKSLVSELSHLF